MSPKDIVISGMSARLPESRNVDEFCNNLFAGIDMVTNKEDRWPNGNENNLEVNYSMDYSFCQVHTASSTEWDAYRIWVTLTAHSSVCGSK